MNAGVRWYQMHTVQRALTDDRDLAREGPAAGKSLAYSNQCGLK
jgi:hypothetical protein